MENGNFTDFDFRTNEQKIADNNAKIAELKAQLSELKAKRYGMENAWAANRASIGDGSAYAQLQNQRYSERLSRDSERRENKVLDEQKRKEARSDIEDLKGELRIVKSELQERVLPTKRVELENQYYKVISQIHEREDFLGRERTEFPPPPKFSEGTSLSNFKEDFSQIQDSEWTDAKKSEKLAEYAAASEEEGYGDFIASVRKRPTVEDKARGKKAAKKAAADAIKRLKERGENNMDLIAFNEGRLTKFSDDFGTYEKIKGEWIRTAKK